MVAEHKNNFALY